jgi:hypothetical protein
MRLAFQAATVATTLADLTFANALRVKIGE